MSRCCKENCQCKRCCPRSKGDCRGVLKFSGRANGGPGDVIGFLADTGTGNASVTPLKYPFATPRRLQNLAINVRQGLVALSSVKVQLLKNGIVVPGFEGTVTGVVPNDTILVVPTSVVSFLAGDTFDLQAVTNGLSTQNAVDLSATVDVVS